MIAEERMSWYYRLSINPLHNALKALTEGYRAALGEHIILFQLLNEWASYATLFHKWEIDNYLDLLI